MTKRSIFIFLLFIFTVNNIVYGQIKFSDFFENKVLRIDYILAGDSKHSEIYLQELKQENQYAGSKMNFVDFSDYGTYRYRLFDYESNRLIFSKGFCPLFEEWQTTDEATIMKKGFYQVAILPFPKNKVRFVIDSRDKDNNFLTIFSTDIDPENYFIRAETPPAFEVETIVKNGNPSEKVDLVFLPEGYRKEEMPVFIADVKRMVDSLFSAEPFNQYKDAFNIYAVKVPSQNSGTDIPGDKLYVNTAFNSSFYTFDVPRYLTSSDMKAIHDAASVVSYDHICVLVNSSQYGGGGFYNYLCLCTSNGFASTGVFIHEFGHSFAGLADEYYTSDVAYNSYYNLKVEPWEPNITTLVDFDNKWKHMVSADTPVPTPRSSKYANTVGVFEGGGYVTKGIYSPVNDCRMKRVESAFCPACSEAIVKTIKQHF